MADDIMLLLEKGRIREYEKDILTAGMCEYLLPMRFVSVDEKVQVTYDCAGYCPVGELKDPDTGELLQIMEKIFLILSGTGEHFIPPGRIMLSEETVFYDRRKGRVKIAYVPVPGKAQSVKLNAGAFIRAMRDKAPAEMKSYFTKAQEALQIYNYSPADMADMLTGIKREYLYLDNEKLRSREKL